MSETLPTIPIAPKKPHTHEIHNHKREDPYFWLRERENPEVIQYLKEENTYTHAALAPTASLQEELFEEMKGRIKPDDTSVPYLLKDYWYYSRFETGKEYLIYCRKKGSLEAEEEIILDTNVLAEGKVYCRVANIAVHPDQQRMAYAVDFMGRRIYEVFLLDLQTGALLPDRIPEVTANMTWGEDGEHLYYTRQDQETLRPHQIYQHKLGTEADADVLLYEEKDDTFRAGISKSKSKQFLFIVSSSTLSSEVRFAPADQPYSDWKILEPRETEHEYSVDHFGDYFYLLTNHEARNFRLMRTPVHKTGLSNWEDVIPHRDDVLLEDVELFQHYLVLDERTGGLSRLRVLNWAQTIDYHIPFRDPVYTAGSGFNPEMDTPLFRYQYSSLTTPNSTYQIDLSNQETTLLKQQPVLGGFKSEEYISERIYATAKDGTKVPVSLVYHKDTQLSSSTPLLLYAYGSYGYSMEAYFSLSRLSLLNRGFVFAIAHVRGGSEMGRYWYEDGRQLKKKNTFTDFIECAEHLIAEGYTSSEHLYCMGGSAGGLLIGAVINMRPDLFKGAIADVPFVDVITTMLDTSIPLTTGEYDEWGNPNDKAYYDYILSYSPYDNVEAKSYPNLLVNTGLHDSQVQYWEPAKWVAKMRDLKKGEELLLLYTDMEAGHGGPSGRYQPLKDLAKDYAFLMMLEGRV